MASSNVTLEREIGFDALIAEIERLVRSGVHPDRISVSQYPAAQWVCSTHWAYSDSSDDASVARRVDAQVALLRLLLEHGADPNRRKNRNSTPLAVCCGQLSTYSGEHHRVLEKLGLVLAAGGDPKQTKEPAICIALGLRDIRGEISDIPFRDDADEGHADMVLQAIDMLLKAGADMEAMDQRGMYTPVLMAAYLGSLPLLQLLRERGANVHATNTGGSNALMFIAGDVEGLAGSRAGISATWHRFGDPVATTRQLLDWGLDPAAANARGRTPLRLAVNAGNLDVAAVLAEALAARAKLVAADVRLFKGTEYEARVAALTTTVPTKKPPKVNANLDSAAQRASWERARTALNDHLGEPPNRESRWFLPFLHTVFEHLATGADPRVPPQALYAEYASHFTAIRLSKTKSWLSRSGVVEVDPDLFWTHLRIRYSQAEDDNFLCREEVLLALSANALPTVEEVAEVVGRMCAQYLKTQG